MDRFRAAIRTHRYSPRTEQACAHWIKRFIFLHNKRHPIELGEPEISAFDRELAGMENVTRAKRPQRLPVMLTRQEVRGLPASWFRRRVVCW